jgi:hypothetical protein
MMCPQKAGKSKVTPFWFTSMTSTCFKTTTRFHGQFWWQWGDRWIAAIQTPVSPDGKFVISGNTLTGAISTIDAITDMIVRSVTCDPGCHGLNSGAKEGGGYYAYVTSKFSNRLIVLAYDPNGDGDVSDAVITGWVVLDDSAVPAPTDDTFTGNKGMGGRVCFLSPMCITAGYRSFLRASVINSRLRSGIRSALPLEPAHRVYLRHRYHLGTLDS